ncbi:DinB family protein [Nitriliruptor alkaliphilus]|uniref:DinB family protein n=1 Tax=Nitriliruptor alkaliphilus TaxID=427918 RepID=UPI0009FA0143|nr:DinB family protein [Nitriliruptor alkaliphilus]
MSESGRWVAVGTFPAEGADTTGDGRTEPPGTGDERATLLGFLRWQRETLEWKCSGLDAEQLARRAVEPSTMSLLGMVRHLTDVERNWFRRFLAGEDTPFHYWTEDAPDGDWAGAIADPGVVAESWRRWREEVAFADAFVANAPDLDITADHRHHGTLSLRWVLTHMIEEYARHNGHADLLRERIDGAVGE